MTGAEVPEPLGDAEHRPLRVRVLSYKLTGWKQLVAFADIGLADGLVLKGVTIFRQDGKYQARPPSTERQEDNVPLYDPAGRRQRSYLVTFITAAHRERFSAAVIEALTSVLPPTDAEGGA